MCEVQKGEEENERWGGAGTYYWDILDLVLTLESDIAMEVRVRHQNYGEYSSIHFRVGYLCGWYSGWWKDSLWVQAEENTKSIGLEQCKRLTQRSYMIRSRKPLLHICAGFGILSLNTLLPRQRGTLSMS